MADLGTMQSPLSGAQIMAKLITLSRGAVASVEAIVPPTVNTPVGLTIFAAQTIQAARIAQGWSVSPGVKLAQFTFAR